MQVNPKQREVTTAISSDTIAPPSPSGNSVYIRQPVPIGSQYGQNQK